LRGKRRSVSPRMGAPACRSATLLLRTSAAGVCRAAAETTATTGEGRSGPWRRGRPTVGWVAGPVWRRGQSRRRWRICGSRASCLRAAAPLPAAAAHPRAAQSALHIGRRCPGARTAGPARSSSPVALQALDAALRRRVARLAEVTVDRQPPAEGGIDVGRAPAARVQTALTIPHHQRRQGAQRPQTAAHAPEHVGRFLAEDKRARL
jgi:hypothetical protein